MERKASFGWLSVKVFARSLICCTTLIQAVAMADGPDAAREAISNTLYAVRTQFSDGSSRRGQAIAVANHFGGIVAVTANSVVRSDQPDNKTVSVTVTYRSFDETKTASIPLAEIRDRQLNLGLLFAPHEKFDERDERPEYVCQASELPGGGEVTILRRDISTGELNSVVGRVVQGFDAGNAVVQIAQSTQRVDELMGAPVLVGDAVVGLVTKVSNRESDLLLTVVSASDLIRFLAKFLIIRVLMEPTIDCLYSQIPIGRSVNELRRRVRDVLAQGSWPEIQRGFAASDADLVGLFGTTGAKKARKALDDNLLAIKASSPGPPPSRAGVVTECYEIPAKIKEGATPSYNSIEFQRKPGRLECSVTWEAADSGENYTLESFAFINGHWIWLP